MDMDFFFFSTFLVPCFWILDIQNLLDPGRLLFTLHYHPAVYTKLQLVAKETPPECRQRDRSPPPPTCLQGYFACPGSNKSTTTVRKTRFSAHHEGDFLFFSSRGLSSSSSNSNTITSTAATPKWRSLRKPPPFAVIYQTCTQPLGAKYTPAVTAVI